MSGAVKHCGMLLGVGAGVAVFVPVTDGVPLRVICVECVGECVAAGARLPLAVALPLSLGATSCSAVAVEESVASGEGGGEAVAVGVPEREAVPDGAPVPETVPEGESVAKLVCVAVAVAVADAVASALDVFECVPDPVAVVLMLWVIEAAGAAPWTRRAPNAAAPARLSEARESAREQSASKSARGAVFGGAISKVVT